MKFSWGWALVGNRDANLPKAAKGQPCQFGFKNVCNRNPETSVLAHYSPLGHGITGARPPDESAGVACYDCHNFIDFRDLSRERRLLRDDMVRSGEFACVVLDGILLTHLMWIRLGIWKRKTG